MNNDKFNTAYHAWSDDHITTCRPGGGNLNLGDPAIEYIFLTKTIPKEFSLAVDPQIKQEYEGITYNNEGFKIAVSDSRPCKIVQGRKNSDEFDVIFFFDSRHLPRDKVKAQDAHVLIPYKNLEAKYVRFQSRPFKSDMLAPTAFRHEIAIPDERFPPLWKDLE